MTRFLFQSFQSVVALAVVVLIGLAALRVASSARLVREIGKDEGRHWRSLSWEFRRSRMRPLTFINWAFSLLFIAVLVYGVWYAYYGSTYPGL